MKRTTAESMYSFGWGMATMFWHKRPGAKRRTAALEFTDMKWVLVYLCHEAKRRTKADDDISMLSEALNMTVEVRPDGKVWVY